MDVLNSFCTNKCQDYYHKVSYEGCFGRLAAQGSVITAFNSFVAQKHVLHIQGFSSSFCQAVAGVTQASTTKVYQQCWKESAGLYAQEDVPKVPFLPLN